MQQSRDERVGVEMHLREERRDRDGVGDVGLARSSIHAAVRRLGHGEGVGDARLLDRREVRRLRLQTVEEALHLCWGV